jgi:MoaA/NifB/PqqE/SkfB family radical SAM enzyme
MKNWTFSIDIVGTCNLRCPSCPVGNANKKNNSGLMSLDLFKEILDKIAEQPNLIPKIDLYNWGEPSLHNRLPEFVAEVNRRGWFSGISSNLNTQFVDRLLEEPPTKLRLSVSGFNQGRYGVTHAKGDINHVKANWQRLVYLKSRKRLNTLLEVAFHVYKNNKTDLLQWASLASQSGAIFSPVWSLYQPMEELVQAFETNHFSDDFQRTSEMMEVHPIHQIALGREIKVEDCRLRKKQTAINWDGSVALCCSVYDANRFTIAKSFIDTNWDDLQAIKYNHDFCNRCFKSGGPGTFEAHVVNKIDDLAVENQIKRNSFPVISIKNGLNISGPIDIKQTFFESAV